MIEIESVRKLGEMGRTAMNVGGVRVGISYGLDRVCFTSPITAGSRVRGEFYLDKFQEVENWVLATWSVSVECEGGGDACVVASWLVRYYF